MEKKIIGTIGHCEIGQDGTKVTLREALEKLGAWPRREVLTDNIGRAIDLTQHFAEVLVKTKGTLPLPDYARLGYSEFVVDIVRQQRQHVLDNKFSGEAAKILTCTDRDLLDSFVNDVKQYAADLLRSDPAHQEEISTLSTDAVLTNVYCAQGALSAPLNAEVVREADYLDVEVVRKYRDSLFSAFTIG